MRQPAADVTEDTVLQEFRKGFRINGKLIRPAMVSVAVPEEARGGAYTGLVRLVSGCEGWAMLTSVACSFRPAVQGAPPVGVVAAAEEGEADGAAAAGEEKPEGENKE